MSLYPEASELLQRARAYKSNLDAIYRQCNALVNGIDADNTTVFTTAKELNNCRRQLAALNTALGGSFDSMKGSLAALYGVVDVDQFIIDAENVRASLLIPLLTYIRSNVGAGSTSMNAQTGEVTLADLPANVITEIKARANAILAVY